MTAPSDRTLPDRGRTFDEWAPRLQHEPLVQAMTEAAAVITSNGHVAVRRIVRKYLGAVDVDALAADVAARLGGVGELGHHRTKAVAECVVELLTPDPAGTRRKVPEA